MNIVNIIAIIIGYVFIGLLFIRTIVYLDERYINKNRITRW